MDLQTALAESPRGCAILLLNGETICVMVSQTSILLYERYTGELGCSVREIERSDLNEMRDFADRRAPDMRANESIRWQPLGSGAITIPPWVQDALRADDEQKREG